LTVKINIQLCSRRKYLVKISICDDWKLVLNWLKKLHSNIKSSIGPMAKLLCISDGSKWSSSLGLAVKGTSPMPPGTKGNIRILHLHYIKPLNSNNQVEINRYTKEART